MGAPGKGGPTPPKATPSTRGTPSCHRLPNQRPAAYTLGPWRLSKPSPSASKATGLLSGLGDLLIISRLQYHPTYYQLSKPTVLPGHDHGVQVNAHWNLRALTATDRKG